MGFSHHFTERNAFREEEEREMGLRGEMRRALGGKGRAVVEIAEGEGLDASAGRVIVRPNHVHSAPPSGHQFRRLRVRVTPPHAHAAALRRP
jgi:hypothetical protein